MIFAVLCIVLAGSLVAWAAWPSETKYAGETAQVRDLDTYHSYEGNVEAKDSQLIYATSTSTMKKIYVNEGDTVSKGDLLYELEGDNAESKLTQSQASVTSAKVTLQDAKSNLGRMTELYNAGAVSQTDYEQAKSNYQVASAQLTQAQANYNTAKNDAEDLKGYADTDGEVSDIFVKENDTMLSGTEIMDVINYDRLIVKIKIDEFDLASVTSGQKATAVITALNKEIPGTITDISKKAEVVNGVSYFNAEVALDPDDALKVGLSAEIKVHSANAPQAVTISMKALQFGENNAPYVLMRNEEGKIATHPVTAGINDGTYVEIKDGLKAGDTVLIPQSNSSNSDSGFTPPGGGRLVNQASQKESK